MGRYLYKFVGSVALLLIITSFAGAQDRSDQHWKEYDLEYRTFRFTLVPGLTTNGIDAHNYAAKYSWNILAGYHGGLENGFEFGGLVNAHKYYAHGVQIAGLANYTGQNTAGVQLAGLANYSGTNMQGIQLAGIGNWSNSDMQGVQLAGILNLSRESSQGLQFSGVANISNTDMQGLLGAGTANISGGNMQGLLFSGLLNIARDDMQGIAASGVLNYSKSFQGIALSTINASKSFQGIQSGLVNVADNAQGIQFGLINYAREFEGVPVGLISYYGDGRVNIDTWTSETGFSNVGLKLGTHEVYNMISIGYNPLLDRDVWQIGWSIGRHHEYENHFLYTDFSYFKINEGGWTSDLNSKYKYRLLFGKEFYEELKLYGGPTLNMLISKVPGRNSYTQYRLFDFGAKGREYIFWLGLSVGVELF
ncbi:hypothetical protein [Fodinibius sp. Rm-B-1B1-1]|uniref:hypothetical protein n=1 Tax=Fodinibius alkaliphilus TaxID=3140241 RepID=UPI00315B0DE1